MFLPFAIFSDYALLALRLALGLIVVAHGWPKLKDLRGTGAWMASVGFRPGILWAAVAAVVEFFGGLLFIAGIFVQPIAALLVGQFTVITIWKLARRENFKGSIELDILILAAALVLLSIDGGSLAFGGL